MQAEPMLPITTRFEIRQAREASFRRLVLTQAGLIVVRAGTKIVRLPDGRTLHAEAGEAIALSAGVRIDVINRPAQEGGYRAEVVSFADALLERVIPNGQSRSHGSFPVSVAFDASLEWCRIAMSADGDLPAVVQEHRLKELLVWTSTFGIALRPAAPGLSMTIRRLVEVAPDRPWTAQNVRDALSEQGKAMSEATLRRRLALEGETLQGLVTDMRMMVGLGRLQATADPISLIAAECGYQSPSRFAVRFRTRFGITPSEVRGHCRHIERNGTRDDRSGTLPFASE